MSNCYKCGKELPEFQVECEDGCQKHVRPSPEEMRKFGEFLQHQLNKRRHIDWSKVESFEDLRLVISTIFCDATLDPDSAAARQLAKFLLPKREDHP